MGDLIKFKNLGKNEKVKLALLILASVILVAILIANYKRSYQPIQVGGAAKKRVVVIKDTKELKAGKVKKRKPIEIEALLQGVGREDPFSPASEEVRPVRVELSLVGIIWGEDKPLAVIGDTIVAEGDMIRDKKVIKIEDERVVLRENEVEYTVELGGSVF